MPAPTPHHIVFLDSRTLNPGDLSWKALQARGSFTEYASTRPEEVIARAAQADILITNKVALGEAEFSALPALRLVCVAATGYDVIDTAAARRHGVTVTNCAGYGTRAVAQMTLALLLEATNRVGHYARANRNGFWSESSDFCCWNEPLLELADQPCAVVGFGHIGRAVTDLLRAFGARLYAVTSKPQEALPPDVARISLAEAFATCRVVSLNCPLTAENERFVNAALLAQTRPDLILINTARGRLIDDEAVAAALRADKIAAYCCDVLSQEPPRADHPILCAPRTFVTPHIAWATPQARERIVAMIAHNIDAFFAGKPENVVNP